MKNFLFHPTIARNKSEKSRFVTAVCPTESPFFGLWAELLASRQRLKTSCVAESSCLWCLNSLKKKISESRPGNKSNSNLGWMTWPRNWWKKTNRSNLEHVNVFEVSLQHPIVELTTTILVVFFTSRQYFHKAEAARHFSPESIARGWKPRLLLSENAVYE